MDLERSRKTVGRLSELDEVSVEDVLNLIYDICQDVKEETGVAVDKLPCHDAGELYRRLPWMARLVMRISSQNEALITDAARQERLRELNEELQKLENEQEEKSAQLSDEEAQRVLLSSEEIRRKIQVMEERTARLASLREKLSAECLPENAEDEAAMKNIAQSVETGLAQIGKKLTSFSLSLRDYADRMSDV